MPVYDFSSGFNALNQGIGSIGTALQQADQTAYHQSLLQKVNAGDWTGALDIASKHGDLDTWSKLQNLKTTTGPAPTLDSLMGGSAPTDQSASGAPSPSSGQASTTPASATPGVAPGYGSLGRQDITNMLVSKAQERGIDPGKAVKVYTGEGLKAYVGDEGSSFGPLQLHMGGISAKYPNRGLGDVFYEQTHLDPRNPSTVPQQIEFGLDWAAKHGWGDWTSQKDYARFEGIGPNAQPRGISVAGRAGAAVPGGGQIAPAGMGVPQFATSTATPPQQFGRSTAGTPMRAIGPSVTALTTPGEISPAAGGITSTFGANDPNAAPSPAGGPVWRATDGTTYAGPSGQRDAGPGAVLVQSTGSLPPMPPMVSGVTGGPARPAVAPVQVASVGGTAGLTAPGAAPPTATPAASATPANPDPPVMIGGKAWTRKAASADDSPSSPSVADVAKAQGIVGDIGASESAEEVDSSLASGEYKYGGIAGPAAAPAAAGEASAAGITSQAAAAMSGAPPQYQAAARGLFWRSLAARGNFGDPRRVELLGQAEIMAQQNALRDPRWKPIGDMLTIQYKAETDAGAETRRENAPPSGYLSYKADEIAAGRKPLSQNDWQHQNSEKNIRPATAQEKIDYPGLTGMFVDENGKPLKPFYAPVGAAKPTPQQEYDARLPVAQKLGLQPGTPEFNSYMTGGPAGKQPFSKTEEDLISKADDQNTKLTLALGALTKAQKILPNTRSGSTAGLMTWVDRNDPTGVLGTAKVGADTTEYDNLVQSTALGILKELFGGRVTNFEDQQFQALQPNSGKSMQEKQQILADLIDRYQSQQQAAQAKLVRLQGKSYFGASGPGGAGAPPNAPQGPNPSVQLQGSPGGPPRPAAPPPPKVGEVRRGYTFKGGNPADPNSWAPVQ